MILTDITLNILNALEGVNTVIFGTPSFANFRLDRKPAPYALLYPAIDITDTFNKQNSYKEGLSIEVFFCDLVPFDSDGYDNQTIVDNMYEVAKVFVHQLLLNKDIMIDGEVKMVTGYGKYDKTVTGVSVECKLLLRQPICLESSEPETRTLTITQNGAYNVLQYGTVIVDVREPEPVVDRNYLCFTNVEDGTNLITLDRVGEPESVTCEYTLDGTNWIQMDTTPDDRGICDYIVLEKDQKVWLRGTGSWLAILDIPSGQYRQYCFQSTGLLDVSGNILSLYNKDEFDTMTEMPRISGFGAFKKHPNTQTTLYLKVRNAELNFDNITYIPRVTGGLTYYSEYLFAGTNANPNTYLQSAKITIKDGAGFDMGNTSSYKLAFGNFFAYCPNLKTIWLPNWNSTERFSQYNFTIYGSSTGTIYIPQGKTIANGIDAVPATWSIVYYNPETGEVIE